MKLVQGLFIMSITMAVPKALEAQNDPLKGQDSLLLELERTEILPASIRQTPKMEKLKPEPEPIHFSYTKDSVYFSPQLPSVTFKEENLGKPIWEKLNSAYIKIGMGIWLNPIAQISLAQTRDQGIDWSIFASHRSNHRNWVGLSSQREEQLQIKAAWLKPNFQAYTRINFKNHAYFWYADSSLERTEKPIDSLKMSYTTFSMTVGLKKQNKQGFSYDVPIEIRNYSDKIKLKEFNFHAAPQMQYIAESGIGGGVQTQFWTASGMNDSLFPNRMWFWADVLGMYKKGKIFVEAGARLNYAKPDSQTFNVYPIIHAKYQISNNFGISANISGSASHLSIFDLRQENRFLGRNFYLHTIREKIKTELGVHVGLQNLKINVIGGYRILGNNPIYYASYQLDTVQNIISSDAKHFIIYDNKTSQTYFLADLQFTKKSYAIGLEGFYSINRLQNLTNWFHYPAWKLKLYGKLQVLDKFNLTLQLFTLAARPFTVLNNQTVKSTVLTDLQLIAEYRMTPTFSIWLEGTNILNQKYQKWYLYQEMPLQVSAGIGLKL